MNHDARTLLTALGDDGYLSVCWQQPGAEFASAVVTLPEALDSIEAIGNTANLWYGVNRMASKPAGGRGLAKHVTRVTCLYADLDTGKALTPGSITEARTIIDGLPDPAFIVQSGHGLPADLAAHRRRVRHEQPGAACGHCWASEAVGAADQ